MSARADAIVIGLDSPIGLSVIRELGGHGLRVHGVIRAPDDLAVASRHCDATTLRPAGHFRDWLPGLIDRTGARAVFAITENDLLQLCDLPRKIGDCHLLVPRAQPLAQVIDKLRTLEIAEPLGLSVPHSWQPRAGEDFAAQARGLAYPLIAKWANPPAAYPLLDQAGLEWFKTEYVRDGAALLALLERYRPVGHWPLIQHYCAGVGLGHMLHMAGGQATLRFQHRRLHEWPPEGGVSTLCRAEPIDAAQMALSERLLRTIGWEGPAMVEYRHDPATGRYCLMEVNGRFWGSLPLARHCGAHFAWESYRRTVLGDASPAPAPRTDLKARYMVPETKRLARLLLAAHQIGDPFFEVHPVAEAIGYITACFDPRMRYYVFSLADPRPWLRDLGSIARKIAGKIGRREKRPSAAR